MSSSGHSTITFDRSSTSCCHRAASALDEKVVTSACSGAETQRSDHFFYSRSYRFPRRFFDVRCHRWAGFAHGAVLLAFVRPALRGWRRTLKQKRCRATDEYVRASWDSLIQLDHQPLLRGLLPLHERRARLTSSEPSFLFWRRLAVGVVLGYVEGAAAGERAASLRTHAPL